MNLDYINIFKVLSDKNRLEIINIIKKNNEICACDLLKNFKITQATFSYHMKVLKECKLVNCYKKGTWCIYSLNENTVNELEIYFHELKGDKK